jgi:ATP-binding cassette subfamily B protein
MANTGAPKDGSDRAMLTRLVREIRPDARFLVGALVLYAPILLVQLGQPLIVVKITDDGYRALDLGVITLWAGIYIGSVAAQSGLEMVQLYLMQIMGQRAVKRLRARLFAKIQRLSMSYFDYVPLGKVMTRVTNDVESLSELFASGAVRIIGDILFLLGTIIMLFVVDWKLALAALATMPILAIGMQLFRVRAREAFRRVRAMLSELNGYLQEHLSGMHIVQLFGQEKRIHGTFEVDNKGYMMANREAIALDAGIYAFVDAMSTVTVAVVLLVGAGLHERGLLTLGVLVGFEQALRRFFFPIRELSNKYTIIQSALASAERIYGLEDTDETIKAPEDPKPPVFDEELRFDDVVFAYAANPDRPDEVPPDVLQGLSFTVKKGERVAVVGHTGAGKSTIVKLLDRTYDVRGGAIRLDGEDIRDIDLKGLRGLSTAVPQDVFLFSGTLRENLAYGSHEATDAQLVEAAKACQADGVLDRHGGLDGEVRERGTNLSLGERQLLALTRALVTDPPILILDEATASVDRETERRLQAATEKLMEGRTALIVAHRLSTIEKCDRILVMQKGRLAEAGTHDELMEQGGIYAALVELQRREGG